MNVWSALKEWRRTISAIEYSVHQQSLDSRENDLIWLLRSDNPRFRTSVLKSLLSLRYRSERLISEVANIIEDDNCDSVARLLAVKALDHLLRLDEPDSCSRAVRDDQTAARLQQLLDGSLPPMIDDAVRQVLSNAGLHFSALDVSACSDRVSGTPS